MSGNASERVAVVTARARSLPALTYSIAEGREGNPTCTCPASRSTSAGLSGDVTARGREQWWQAAGALASDHRRLSHGREPSQREQEFRGYSKGEAARSTIFSGVRNGRKHRHRQEDADAVSRTLG